MTCWETNHFIQRLEIGGDFLLLNLRLVYLLLIWAQFLPIVKGHFAVNFKLHFDYCRGLHTKLRTTSGDLVNTWDTFQVLSR